MTKVKSLISASGIYEAPLRACENTIVVYVLTEFSRERRFLLCVGYARAVYASARTIANV